MICYSCSAFDTSCLYKRVEDKIVSIMQVSHRCMSDVGRKNHMGISGSIESIFIINQYWLDIVCHNYIG